jgi:glutamate-1-semialdehyde 2,1-aminomutase
LVKRFSALEGGLKENLMKNHWKDAIQHLAGGVNSPVRAFKAVGGQPIFAARALGPYLFDTRGQRYIDYCLSWGAILLGHAEAEMVRAVQKQAALGTSYGTATEHETALAREIKKAFPSMERIRFTSSGTEAVMGAIRLARGLTGRSRVLKFEGCYHGHSDSLLVKAGSGLATLGLPDSDGIPRALAELTSVLPYNDSEAVKRFFATQEDVSCVIVEPIAGNMGLIPAERGFLDTLRRETRKAGSFLIFDEVITGFRVCYGGAQHLYGIRPDLTVLGKIIGGGLAVGAFGGDREYMQALAPSGRVYQAGTLSGNPLSMAAGLSVLSRLSPGFYKSLHEKTRPFFDEVKKIFKRKGRRFSIQSVGSMFTVFLSDKCPRNYAQAKRSNLNQFKKFFHRMIASGIYWPPSQFETCFVSASHGEGELKKTLGVLSR